MKRRNFLSTSAATAAGASAAAAVMATPAAAAAAKSFHPSLSGRPGVMKLGTQNASDDVSLGLFAAFGLTSICSTLPSRKYDENWSVDSLKALRERVEKHKINLDMVPLPLSSAYITKHEYPDIMKGNSPQRDRDIEDIQNIIRNISRAGIPAAKYNMSILGVVRTERTIGRGGASLSTFVYDKGKQDPPLTEAGPVPADLYWERITYFLERVVPVAAEYKVKIACHPHDPGMPKGKGWRGVETVLGSFDGLKKFVSIKENPYHGLNFCQGTISEDLENPNKEIHEVIRYFGNRKKIFNVHFRNIKGKFLNFQEVLPDDGDVNFLECIKTYKEVGYDGMVMPDHVPNIAGDPRHQQAFAFAFGYIRCCIQTVEGWNSEALARNA